MRHSRVNACTFSAYDFCCRSKGSQVTQLLVSAKLNSDIRRWNIVFMLIYWETRGGIQWGNRHWCWIRLYLLTGLQRKKWEIHTESSLWVSGLWHPSLPLCSSDCLQIHDPVFSRSFGPGQYICVTVINVCSGLISVQDHLWTMKHRL